MMIKSEEGLVFDLKRYAIHDGPGIRIVVFLKGCNLNCAWCHNPEGIEAGPERMYAPARCIGCGTCAKTCKIENDVPPEPFFFRSWVEQYTILKNGSIKVVSPNGGIDGFTQTVPADDIEKTFFVPKMCNHCAKSPCVQVCPVGATFETEEGIVLIDEKYCIGCKYCVQACPYGCRYFHPDKHVVDKCTLCFHRVKKGLNPACMENCPTKARISGDLNDPESTISKFIRTRNVYVLKPHLNTGSKLYYNALNQEVR